MQFSLRPPVKCVNGAATLRSTPRIGGARLQPQQHAQRCARAASTVLRVSATAASTSNVRMIIQGRKLEVTDAIKNFVEDKVSKAVHAFDSQIKEIDVKLSVRGGDAGKGPREHRVELTVYTLRNGVVRAENAEDNLYAAIDLVCDKVQRNLRKLKEKAVSKGRWPGRGSAKGGQVITEVLDRNDTVSELPINKGAKMPEDVLRTKYFYLEPLSVEDAVEKLQMVGHDFYIFREKETKTIQVVYKRKSSGYGVIVPMGDTGADLFPSDPSLIPGDE